MRLRATLLALVAGTSLSAALAAPALALTQVNGDTIPGQLECNSGQPLGILAALACACTTPGVCNIGVACPGGSTSCDNGQHGTCESTLWHSPNDNSCIPSNQSGLNPYTASQILPETFHPTCGQTFTVISRGDAIFHDVFGWYNATTGTPPDPTDLHVMIGCTDGIGTQVTLDVLSDPSYKGGDIGFFMMTPADHTTPTASPPSPTRSRAAARRQAPELYSPYNRRSRARRAANGRSGVRSSRRARLPPLRFPPFSFAE